MNESFLKFYFPRDAFISHRKLQWSNWSILSVNPKLQQKCSFLVYSRQCRVFRFSQASLDSSLIHYKLNPLQNSIFITERWEKLSISKHMPLISAKCCGIFVIFVEWRIIVVEWRKGKLFNLSKLEEWQAIVKYGEGVEEVIQGNFFPLWTNLVFLLHKFILKLPESLPCMYNFSSWKIVNFLKEP